MSVQLSEQSFTLEAFEWTPECESAYHHTPAADSVDHGGEARYIVLGPCRHTTGYRCEPSALSAMGAAVLECMPMPVVLAGKSFPFSSVRSLIMSGLVEHVTRWENAQLEAIFNEDLRCEHGGHAHDVEVHDQGPATHFQRGGNCSHINGLRCSTWVVFATSHPERIGPCEACGQPADLWFIEL